jgi:hypothetical protein
MKVAFALLVSLPAILALPAQPGKPTAKGAQPAAKGAACQFSTFEKFNLGHNHDVNTGTILVGTTIKSGAPKLLGSGCSPAWAVGGALDDNTPTLTSVGAKPHH